MGKCSRHVNNFEYVNVSKDTLLEVIRILGRDIIALRGGATISYRGATIKYSDDDRYYSEPDLAAGMIIFESANGVKVAAMDTVIVRDPIYGYVILDNDTFTSYYEISPVEVEADDVTLIKESDGEQIDAD